MKENSIFKQYENDPVSILPLGQKPQTVKVVKSLPLPGEKPQFEEISVTEIEAQFGFHWIEGFSGPQGFMNQYVTSDLLKKNLQTMKSQYPGAYTVYQSAINNQYSKDFALYKVNDEIGYGVMYVGEKPIPEGQYVCFYAGAFAEKLEKGDMPYSSIGIESKLFAQTLSDENSTTSCIDAQYFGNITRFMNCFPKQEALIEFYELAQGLNKHEIATENLSPHLIVLGEIPVKVFTSACEILPGDMLGYSYAERSYWANQTIRLGQETREQLFHKKNKTPISSFMYRLTTIPIYFTDFKKNRQYTLCNLKECYSTLCPEKRRLILDNKKAIIGEITAADIKEALIVNYHSYAENLSMFPNTDNSSSRVSRSIEILEKHVDNRFSAYLRKANNGSLETVDAFITLKDEKEKSQLLNKLNYCGIFPRIFTKRAIVIEGIDQPHILETIERVNECRIAVGFNAQGCKNYSQAYYVEAIKDFSQSVDMWIYQSQRNPQARIEAAKAHHNLARAYQKSGNISYAIIHFFFAEKLYLCIGKFELAVKEKIEKDQLITEINQSSHIESDRSNAAQTGITLFKEVKYENLLPKFEERLQLFLETPLQYKEQYLTWPEQEQKVMNLFLQIKGLHKIEHPQQCHRAEVNLT